MPFTDNQISALSAPLSAANVKSREQSGRKVSYIEGWHAIAEANRIFGFDGWNRETIECRCVTERETKISQQQADGWRVGYIAKVRLTVGGVIREGTGYGSGIDRDLGAAHESAIKEAETDAMKRGLMTFGNPFGLALYERNASPASTRAGNGNAVPAASTADREAQLKRAGEARDRIKTAIEGANTPKLIDEIITVNKADLEFIKSYGQKTYESIMQLASVRKTEMLASA